MRANTALEAKGCLRVRSGKSVFECFEFRYIDVG